jgi:hypothetical protein
VAASIRPGSAVAPAGFSRVICPVSAAIGESTGGLSVRARIAPVPADQPPVKRSSVTGVTSRLVRSVLAAIGPGTASTAGRPSPAWAWGPAAAAPPPPGAAPATRRPSTPGTAPTAPSARPGARSQMSVRWVIRPRSPIPRTLPQENQQVSSPCQVWNPNWSSSSTSGSFMDRATRVRLVDHHSVACLQLAQSLA